MDSTSDVIFDGAIVVSCNKPSESESEQMNQMWRHSNDVTDVFTWHPKGMNKNASGRILNYFAVSASASHPKSLSLIFELVNVLVL